MAKLGEVCVINPKDKIENVEMLVSFIPMQKVSETGEIDVSDIREAKDVMKGFTSFIEGDVLMAKITPCMENGKGAIAKGLYNKRGFGSTEFFVIRPNQSVVCSEWIYYYTARKSFRLECERNMTGSAGQKRVPKRFLEKCEIPVPSLETQKQIAATLDKVTHTIDLCNALLGKLDLLVKARFVEMFGDLANPECKWEKRKLVEACANNDDIKCGPFGTQLNKDEYTSSGVAVWEIPQINSLFQTLPVHFLTPEKADQLQAYSLIQGDIAMSRKGNVGKCAIFPKGFDDGIIHSDVLRIRLDFSIANPQFMMCQLHFSGDVQRQIEQVSTGAIMAGVNVTKLKQISVYTPPIELQHQFAAFVEQTDKSKLAVQQVLKKAETLKKALMQEYFG